MPVASNGYVIVYVGKKHHLADVRGYAYQHRLVAEEKLGRRLRAGEIAHHINENKTDNRRENIEVLSGHQHRVEHRRRTDAAERWRNPGERNTVISCAGGCGAKFRKFDNSGRRRRYAPGHNRRACHGS